MIEQPPKLRKINPRLVTSVQKKISIDIMKNFYDFNYLDIPQHTQDALENYFLRGWSPGGFVTAVLANDLMRACTSCDPQNRESLVDIAKWVHHRAPTGSWGNYATVTAWLNDVDQRQTIYADTMEKQAMWKVLSE